MSRSGTPPTPEAAEDLCVARVPIFRGLTHQQQHEVAQVARPIHLDPGERAYAVGSHVSQLMVVHTGSVKISRISVDGREQIIRVLADGDFIGESAFLSGERPDHEATALEASELCVFRHADLSRLVEKHPSIGLTMLQQVSRRLGDAETRLAAVVSGDVTSRLADYLLNLPMRRGTGPGAEQTEGTQPGTDGTQSAEQLAVELPLAKKDIASLLDTTPESLSRQLRALSDAGVIEQQGRDTITILDVDALVALATQQ